eukprot:TRINITY_DN2260_c0_g3_i1.p1 TRINITY_DN2260_c0_g3~~TRINITY_DN2260_c0_g3_i1.p1  ORF type:complete len:102 (-),score=1.32 TRINITY_DN2260_c0_g3_i1:356-661(-)
MVHHDDNLGIECVSVFHWQDSTLLGWLPCVLEGGSGMLIAAILLRRNTCSLRPAVCYVDFFPTIAELLVKVFIKDDAVRTLRRYHLGILLDIRQRITSHSF